jgi:hypothetical protein
MSKAKRRIGAYVFGAFVSLVNGSAHAEPILDATSAELESLRLGYERMEDAFVTPESGLFLDPIIDPTRVALVEGFFAQSTEPDFETYAGLHPYEVIAQYDEYGDEGNFAGIASVGVAARLIVLKKEGAPESEIARARDAAVRAARAWHVYGSIAGNGVVARGVRRVTPWDAGDPAFPGPAPEIVALKDGQGAPLPAEKTAVWRAPVAPGFDGWVWFDDTSKDQVSGYALAVAWLWDALKDDPNVDQQVMRDLEASLGAVARALMQVAPEKGIDLCLRDADGRLTNFHDLNPRSLSPMGDPLEPESPILNGFNALLALGVIRAAYHVTGDETIGRYYYEELIGRRKFVAEPTLATVGLMYLGARTNYSNVNMAALGFATLCRFETDAYVNAEVQVALRESFWDAGSERDASHVEQAWFDVIYGAYAGNPPDTIPTRVRANLAGFPVAPCLERDRVNCDEGEIAARSCIGLDGTPIELEAMTGHNGQAVAKAWLPMRIRPDSDFMWRSDPHTVNGTANTRMDPRGDWLAAYWLARLSAFRDASENKSPNARPALPYTLGEGGGGGEGGAGGALPIESANGCGCALPRDRSNGEVAFAGLVGLWIWLRARSRRRV